jgi:hypothetical protein
MATVATPVRVEKITSEHAWSYLGRLALISISLLVSITAAKFFIQHKVAPRNAGIQGALAQPRLDLLLMGSSHTRKSYDMRLLEEKTGIHSSFLVSYDGADAVSMAQMLEILTERHDHSPRHVVVEAYSVLLARGFDLQDPRFYLDAPPSLKLTIIRRYLKDRPNLSAVRDIAELVTQGGSDEIVTYPLSSPLIHMGSFKGGRTDLYFPGMTADAFYRLTPRLYGTTPHPAEVSAIHHILDLARARHFAVIFIDTPMPGPVESDPTIQALKRDFRQLLTALGATYIDGALMFPTGDPSLFADSNHVSSRGRTEFTERISGTLRSWVMSTPVE